MLNVLNNKIYRHKSYEILGKIACEFGTRGVIMFFCLQAAKITSMLAFTSTPTIALHTRVQGSFVNQGFKQQKGNAVVSP